MAKKQCPVCGRSVAPQAQYCIYCAARFDETQEPETREAENTRERPTQKSALGLIVTLISLVLIAIVLLLVFLGPTSPFIQEPTEETTTTTVVTTTTRDAARDAWRQSFVGYWYDESSAGKSDLKKQGGYVLYIEEIFRDFVTFNLLSYEGGDGGAIASATISKAVLEDDTLHFTFDDDTLGHAGEGFLRLAEDQVQMEVMIDGEDGLPEDEHTLAVYAVFIRRALPQSEGHDLKELTTLEKVKAAAGKPTAEAVKDDKGNTTYTFSGLQAVTDKTGKLTKLIVEYAKLDNKSAYCYDCVDGTMTYDTIKTYFGEALHDYVEQPTDIRVLHYALADGGSVTFTFDAENNLLTKTVYVV